MTFTIDQGNGPSAYLPYAARFGLYSGSWEHFRGLLDLYLPLPYLDGKVSFDTAMFPPGGGYVSRALPRNTSSARLRRSGETLHRLLGTGQACLLYSSKHRTRVWIDSYLDFSKMKVPLLRHYLARIGLSR